MRISADNPYPVASLLLGLFSLLTEQNFSLERTIVINYSSQIRHSQVRRLSFAHSIIDSSRSIKRTSLKQPSTSTSSSTTKVTSELEMAEIKRIAVVTGANKGIGFEICRQLASNGVKVILTARDEGRGTEAVEKLKSSGASDVLFHQLDVADSSSVASLAEYVKSQFGKLDILVNNAGAAGMTGDYQAIASLPIFSEEQNVFIKFTKLIEVAEETNETVEECVNVNYYGTKKVTEALLPLLQQVQSPRIVNITSIFGQLRGVPSESIRKTMNDADELTEERLDELVQSYLNDFKEGKHIEKGWPIKPSAYIISKAALNAYTRILAKKYPKFCVNCVAPGFVKTDMNFHTGILTAEEGAKGPVICALFPDGSPSGLFYDQTEVVPFE